MLVDQWLKQKESMVAEKECLAIIWTVDFFWSYIYERESESITDHKALK